MTAPRAALDPLAPALALARRRWRLRHLAAGAAITVGAAALVVLLASWALESLHFTAEAVTTARVILAVVTLVVAGRFVAWPLLRRLSDERLALYLEEKVPALEGAVLTAVAMRAPAAAQAHSPLLARGLETDAVRRLARQAEVPALERPGTQRALMLLAAVTGVAALLFTTGPAWVRTGASLLLAPWRHDLAAPVYAIGLEPRTVTVARGADVQLNAQLAGFQSELVELVVRRGARAEWERVPMGAGTAAGSYSARLFDMNEDADFFVEASGVRSATGHVSVRDLPGVARVGVELRFPAYMNLPAEVTDDGGDIAAPEGTTAILRVHATRAVKGGVLRFDGGAVVPLARADDSTLTARLVVQHDGFYRVELEAEDGTRVPGTVEYVVDALDDAPPVVRIRKPGRDLRPTNVDEILVEAEATDDYGVSALELVYRVNGGPEKTIALGGDGKPVAHARDLVASHTLFLEEMALTAGDVVSYYARARDNDAIHGPKVGASDIQFLTIRPFNREYKQNQQGGGGGGGDDVNPGTLVQRQRDIVAGTFKVERDRARTAAATLRTDVSTLHLAQGRLREDLSDVLTRVSRPAVQAADSGFRVLAEVLPKARDEMKAAEELLVQGKTSDALAPEQRALQWLEKAEAAFREVQISMQQQSQGGGGNAAAKASDLADLLELETDKLRNQYQEVERSREQQGAKAMDELAERLKRLAARQQQELSRQRERAQRGNGGGGAGGGNQRQLADETEKAARELERLAREQQSTEMAETARQLRDAAEQMRRSAAGGPGAAQAAADRLANAQKALADKRDAQASDQLGEAAKRAASLAQEERDVADDVARLGPPSAERAERQRRIDERKQGMTDRVEGLAKDLDRLARENRRTQPGAARAAEGAASAIRDARIADKIRFSRQALRTASPEYAKNIEAMIQGDLDSLAQRVANASRSAAAGRDTSQRASRALAQARDLVRGMSSLEERLRDRQERGQGGAAGQQGQGSAQGQGQQGQGNAQGQAGQGSAQGQRSQGAGQGQQGQGGGQGQQGQGQQGQGAQGQGQGQGGGQGRGQQQGQQQAQGGGGQGGRGSNTPGGSGQGGPSGMGGGQANVTAEEMRQLARELRADRDAAQELRRSAAAAGANTAELDKLIQRMAQLDAGKILGDPAALEQMRTAVVEDLKAWEFALRRQLGATETAGPALGGSDNVPPAYRELVSEYFKSLAKKP
ncbi:MAG: DUF4175 family protein [Gemmatimonadetes bacterium]|nr:DUF4175 family protein [Gemmatimonadota bacterium]